MEYISNEKNEKTRRILLMTMPIIVLACVLAFILGGAFAANTSVVEEVVDSVMLIVKVIAVAVGAIFVLVGVVKFAMAHANEDGPAQQKAILMLAAGIVLVLVGFLVIDTFDVAGWITSITE